MAHRNEAVPRAEGAWRRGFAPTLLAMALGLAFGFGSDAQAAAFTPGNLVVYRVGDGSAALSSVGTAVFLDEYTPAGALVQTVALPTAASGSNLPLIASGSATSEGQLSRSTDGACLLLTGYGAVPGTTGVASSAATTVPRVVGVVSPNGGVDTTSSLGTSYFSTNNVRVAVSDNCSRAWVAGGTSGVVYLPTLAGTPSAVESATLANIRFLSIANGQLYLSSASGSASTKGIATVGSGLPTAAEAAFALLFGITTTDSPSPYAHVFLDMNAGVAGVDTLYIADDSKKAILKYTTADGSTWALAGSIAVTDTIRGLTASVSGNVVTLFGTTGSKLVKATDNNGTLDASSTTLATAATNTALRGVALTPVAAAVLPKVSLSLSTTSASEAARTVITLTATADAPVSGNQTVDLVISGTGVTTGDYTLGATQITILNGQTVGQTTLTVVDDATPEATETVTVTLANPSSGVSLGTVKSGSFTILDNDSANTPPSVTVAPQAFSGVIGDANNPTASFTVTDAETPLGSLTVSVLSSSNPAVLPLANIGVSNTAGVITVTANPVGVGYSTLTLRVSDGTDTVDVPINYGASANTGGNANTRWYTGRSDGSAAIALDANYMVVADDEPGNRLSVVRRDRSGVPVAALSVDASLGLNAGNDCEGVTGSKCDGEADLEAMTRVGNRLYVLGSHSNSKTGKIRPDRYRLFTADVSGTGASTSLAFVGYYKYLRSDLLAWDAGNSHGLGANALGLTASAAANLAPEAATLDGFSMEGLALAPDNQTGWLGFRAPLVAAPGQTLAAGRTHALIVPVTNLATLGAAVAGGSAGSASFGAPIRIDLGGRGIRDIARNASGQYLIIAGPPDGATGTAPKDFRLYTWDGSVDASGLATHVQLRAASLSAFTNPAFGGSPEGIVEVPATLADGASIDLISDTGDVDFYGDGSAAKDLASEGFRKFRADRVSLGAAVTGGTVPTATLDGLAALGATRATFKATASGNGQGYYVVLPAAAPVPTAAQVMAGKDGSGSLAAFSGQQAMTGGVSTTFPVTGLSGATAYVVYFVVEVAGYRSGVATLTVTTPAAVPITLISAVQGSGATSPKNGQSVTLEGVVTAVFESASSFKGFFLQEEDADSDGDSSTSEGVFVYTGASSPSASVGDLVRVTGTVSEYKAASDALPGTATEITSPTVLKLVSGVPLPAPVSISLPVTDISVWERYEGMLVRFPQSLTVTGNYTLGRYGEVELAVGGRLMQPTNVLDPNDSDPNGTTSTGTSNAAAIAAMSARDELRRILLDDGSSTQNPAAIPYIDPVNHTLRLDSTVAGLTGVIDYRFDRFRVQPTASVSFNYAARPGVPTFSGANLRIAAANILNFFTTLTTTNSNARGANSATEFTRQRAKTVAELTQINADVLGVLEMENIDPTAPDNLLAGMNDATAAGTYRRVQETMPAYGAGGDAIKVAMFYKPGVVTPVGSAQLLVDPDFPRPSLAQVFEHTASGRRFMAVMNHFKSKGCDGATGLDLDQGDGQSCFTEKRRVEAAKLLTWLNGLKSSLSVSDVILLGDFNSYAEEDPLDRLRAGGYGKLATATESYQYSNLTGSLDHALATASLAARVVGAAHWNVNADEPTFLDYNTEYKTAAQISGLYDAGPFRSSDHDPVIVGLKMEADPVVPTPTPGPTTTLVVTSGTYELNGVSYAVVDNSAADSGAHVKLPSTSAGVGVSLVVAGQTVLVTSGAGGADLGLYRLGGATGAYVLTLNSGEAAFQATAAGQPLVRVAGAVVTAGGADAQLTARSVGAQTFLYVGQGTASLLDTQGVTRQVRAGEVAVVDASGHLVSLRLGTATGSGTGDAMSPSGFGSSLSVQAQVPRLGGYVPRLGGTLQQLVVNGLAGLGLAGATVGNQGSDGGVVITFAGQSYFLLPLGSVTVDPGAPDGMANLGNGRFALTRQGVTLVMAALPARLDRVAAAVADLGLQVTVAADGHLQVRSSAGNWHLRSAWGSEAGSTTSRLGAAEDGRLYWEDGDGHRQYLVPAVADWAGVAGLVATYWPGATLESRNDGSVLVRVGAASLVVQPDPAVQADSTGRGGSADNWWVGSDGNLYIRVPGSGQIQGFRMLP